jgi:hypothetical protein
MPAAKKRAGNPHSLAGSDRPRPGSHRLIGSLGADEQVTFILVIRRKPGSPPLPDMNYWQTTPLRERRILTPVEYSALHGAHQDDMSKVEAFLTGRGFVVLDGHAGRRTMTFKGRLNG